MAEILGAAIAALAAIVIPLATWSSRRLTKEGRLLLRVEHLGTARVLMADSEEKTVFETHLNRAVAELNEWLDEGNRKRRRIQFGVSISAYIVGAVVIVFSFSFASSQSPWFPTAIGALVGALISAITFVTSTLLSRSARVEAEKANSLKEEAEQSQRIEALRAGVSKETP